MRKFLLLCLTAAALWLSCADKENPTKVEIPSGTFLPSSPLDTSATLLTFNMDVGFEAESMLTANLADPHVVLTQGKSLYAQFNKSRPGERIHALADSLVRISPDVICLQEVLFLANHQDGKTFDFLAMLSAAMDSLGGPSYSSIRQVLNPITIQLTVSDATVKDSLDLYFYEGNALLYKSATLSLVEADSVKYFAGLRNLPYLNSTISILRGALFAKLATHRGTILNVTNTHLEVDAIPSIGSGQAYELRDYLRTKSLGSEATAVLGDFNGASGSIRTGVLLADNYMDTYSGPAPSCCFDIADTSVGQTRRIDFVLARSIVRIDDSRVGLNGAFAVDSGAFRISDHAGVITGLTFH